MSGPILDDAQLRRLLGDGLPQMGSAWIPELDAAAFDALCAYLGGRATSQALAAKAEPRLRSTISGLALLADDQSWKPIRLELERRLKAAAALKTTLESYFHVATPIHGLREEVLLIQTADALERLSAGRKPLGTDAVVRINSDPAAYMEIEPHARATFVALHRQVWVLQNAVAALRLFLKGRPRGERLHPFVRSLADIWRGATNAPATLTRRQRPDNTRQGARHKTEGEFLEFCRLSVACFPGGPEKYGSRLEGAVRFVTSVNPAKVGKAANV